MSSDVRPLVIINAVALTPALLGERTPNFNRLIEDGFLAPLKGVFPAVTCTTQASMVTGALPSQHGIVANGWYFRDLAEILLWRQSNHLVQGEKIWETARKMDPEFSCAKLFWWYNMYAAVDYSITPRPHYPADGQKIPGIYSHPRHLGEQLEKSLGPFPLFDFWGPGAGIRASEWIAGCALELFSTHHPDLTLVYLPHLDYNLQRIGPDNPSIQEDVAALDRVAGKVIDQARAGGADIMVVSEYGIEKATGHVHINRLLREQGYIQVRDSLGCELLDPGASRAFAVADHQVAHVYIENPGDIGPVRQLLEKDPGIERVLGVEEKVPWGIAHPRAGELVAVAEPGHWFTYYYWLAEEKAPDFARTVDIHRKPGFDPVELFTDPDLPSVHLRIGWRLLQKRLGFRMLMDVIPTDASLVKGTHGRLPETPDQGPLLISSRSDLAGGNYSMLDIKQLILDQLYGL
ncbi:MAG: alkaline phosphatase family protein [Gammaproteobacteria bacterium]|nr:alkaline phosphatase family protein [Gammaproteobacteria bacterium]